VEPDAERGCGGEGMSNEAISQQRDESWVEWSPRPGGIRGDTMPRSSVAHLVGYYRSGQVGSYMTECGQYVEHDFNCVMRLSRKRRCKRCERVAAQREAVTA
jgi:hypothetical protein